ncbi:DUF4017 family protein [Bacillus sp. 1P06AnD]|uniref:DUF4017 family protein n=1 Tax=Bacillus sp. 1P06AnD TaxID=3132208 RepID=UPI0039A369F0
MKIFAVPVLIYVLVCAIVLLLPASDGYQSLSWKLFAAQAYALPAFILSLILVFLWKKRKSCSSIKTE